MEIHPLFQDYVKLKGLKVRQLLNLQEITQNKNEYEEDNNRVVYNVISCFNRSDYISI